MEDDDKPKPAIPDQPKPDSPPAGQRPKVPLEPPPDFFNPQTEGQDRVPEVKEKKK